MKISNNIAQINACRENEDFVMSDLGTVKRKYPKLIISREKRYRNHKIYLFIFGINEKRYNCLFNASFRV